MYDHVETVPRREPTHMFEAFTTLAALAQHTSTIKLGQIVTCAAYRNAGLLAKEAACVDVFSGGRLILGLGAGWYEREYQAYGITFPSAGTRLAILDETLEVVKRLWTEETVTFQGKHLVVRRRVLRPEADPAAARDLGRRRRREGDAAHRGQARRQDQLADRARGLRAQVGAARAVLRRDRPRLRLGSCARTVPTAVVFDTEADMQKWLDSPGGGSLWGRGPHDEYVRDNLVGTAEQVGEKVQEFVDAGCREFVLWFRDSPSSDSLEAFARDVIPRVRG